MGNETLQEIIKLLPLITVLPVWVLIAVRNRHMRKKDKAEKAGEQFASFFTNRWLMRSVLAFAVGVILVALIVYGFNSKVFYVWLTQYSFIAIVAMMRIWLEGKSLTEREQRERKSLQNITSWKTWGTLAAFIVCAVLAAGLWWGFDSSMFLVVMASLAFGVVTMGIGLLVAYYRIKSRLENERQV